MKIVAAQGFPNDQLGAVSEAIALQLGVGPSDPIDTRATRVSRMSSAGRLRNSSAWASVVQPGQQPVQQPGAPGRWRSGAEATRKSA